VNSGGRSRPTRADAALLGVVLLLAVAAVPAGTLLAAPSGDGVVIEGPSGSTVLPLHEDARVRVDGACGTMVVSIEAGRAMVVSSDCPEERCLARGAVGRGDGSVVCVPNAVTVTVGGERARDLDAVVR
jgi:hypothetical protein